VLNIIVVFVEHLLRLGEQALSFIFLDELLLCSRHLLSPFLVQIEHALLASLSGGHCRLLLLFEKFPLLGFGLLGLDASCALHTLEFVLLNDDGLGLQPLLGLLADISELLLGERTRLLLLCVACCQLVHSKKGGHLTEE
jgi:hypothetical protein